MTAALVVQVRYLDTIADSVNSQSSTHVTDELLENLSEHLLNLEYLYLVGCPKVTHAGIWSILSKTQLGMKGLGLEGVSPTFVCVSWVYHTPSLLTELPSA